MIDILHWTENIRNIPNVNLYIPFSLISICAFEQMKALKNLYKIVFIIITFVYYHLSIYPLNKKPLEPFIVTSGWVLSGKICKKREPYYFLKELANELGASAI